MSKAKDEMRREYRREDLAPLVRGKYYKEFMAGTNLVLIRPALQKVFPTADAVNNALAALIQIAEQTNRLVSPRKRAAKKRAPI